MLTFENTYHSGNDQFFTGQINADCTVQKKVSLFLEAKGVDFLPWPTQSPDLNSIETFCAVMKWRLRKLDGYPNTAEMLPIRLCIIWNNLPYEYITI